MMFKYGNQVQEKAKISARQKQVGDRLADVPRGRLASI